MFSTDPLTHSFVVAHTEPPSPRKRGEGTTMSAGDSAASV
jgi:hypothetical protein